ncbi:MAG: hypothetical protein HQ541_16900 [Mariniphaga sp.]|nr:hypothetical protein [Mariniphaga sp.]
MASITWEFVALIITGVLALMGTLASLIYKQGNIDGKIIAVSDKVDVVDYKVEKLSDKFDNFLMRPWAEGQSPVKLTKLGVDIYAKEQIKKFVAEKFDEILSRLNDAKPISAYGAQEQLFDIVNSYKNDKEYKVILENEAFKAGQHIDILLKVIAIGMRDEVFNQLHFNVDHIDETNPNQTE